MRPIVIDCIFLVSVVSVVAAEAAGLTTPGSIIAVFAILGSSGSVEGATVAVSKVPSFCGVCMTTAASWQCGCAGTCSYGEHPAVMGTMRDTCVRVSQ